MLTSVKGVYRNGQIELAETPPGLATETRVIVTFLTPGAVDLEQHGIDTDTAAELHARLATFADDWDSPEMAVYDDYEANRRELDAG